ncbi:MAG TPA: UDP-3-O-acyl-N-acetylglucosamine deacetylase [Thiothrix sp.]|nr:UDP-3-O-acyl-N-acetylglucosamine deacetylase [Thiothrix sp.]
MLMQRTIKKPIKTTGVGLHSGKKVTMTLKPAPINTGIVFQRVDLSPQAEIKVSPDYVGETVLSTTLVSKQHPTVKIGTVEHLLSALAGLGIDNIYIELDSPETPILDGSSAPFVYLLLAVGIHEQRQAKQFVRIKKTVKVEQKDSWARLSPFEGFKTSFQIAFNHPAVNQTQQYLSLDLSRQSYVEEISRARTFGFMRDIELLRARQLILGGSLDNAVVLDDFKILNPSGLRYPDEFVKHKILDAIGDLYTLGHAIIGAFHGHKSGHAVNNLLLRALLQDEEAWELVSYEDKTSAPIHYLDDQWALA